jgi:hypothetical protein
MGKKERSPGPAAYTIASTVTKNAPAFSFGTMKRPAPSGGPSMSPGPIYQLKASVGRYKDNTFRSNPSFGFGTSERPDPGGMSKFSELLPSLSRCCAWLNFVAPAPRTGQYTATQTLKHVVCFPWKIGFQVQASTYSGARWGHKSRRRTSRLRSLDSGQEQECRADRQSPSDWIAQRLKS